MKKTLLFLALIFASFATFAQHEKGDWTLSAGVTFIDNSDLVEPFGDGLDYWAIGNPFYASAEYNLSSLFAIEQMFSLNKMEKSDRPNASGFREFDDRVYFASDTAFKFYFDELFLDWNWLDLYASGGVSLFIVDETNTAFTFGGGARFWISPKFGIRLQGLGKFALNPDDYPLANNHFEYSAGLLYKI
ncbi:porin family protein [Mangrovimonas aestuarii]|uniref:hypothetical protein n=1 Tax=Mangrovimonas aestuarii TaxID=3018443 RepID=UPI0023787932|nr:hypothetical protein [Mangrovimonas aestuarii]